MKKILLVAIATLLLTCGVSTASLAEGGVPIPNCSPGHCQ